MTQGRDVQLELVLGGERFRLQVDESRQARVFEVAETVNQRLEDLRGKTGALTPQRAALMAAFQFAYDLKELGGKGAMDSEEIQFLSSKIDRIISRIESGMENAES